MLISKFLKIPHGHLGNFTSNARKLDYFTDRKRVTKLHTSGGGWWEGGAGVVSRRGVSTISVNLRPSPRP